MALDLQSFDKAHTDTALGADADAWFMALDERRVRVGTDLCVARVLGIHGTGPSLWIQLSLCDDSDASVVLQVEPTNTVADVLATLRTSAPTGDPLEIIRVGQAS